jgi:hypothetical protein
MSKHSVLSFKAQLRLEWRGEHGQSETEQPDHSANLGHSITSSTRITFSVHTGVILSANFWRRFATIDNVIAIKVAPFNRNRTLDVLRGVAAAGALDRVALYTGNDDHTLVELSLPFDLRENGVTARAYFRGGLLGHWSVWSASAIRQFEMCKAARAKASVAADLLALDARVTDCNSAFFDVANDFHGCIAGCHEILWRQGLMQGTWCLDAEEGLSPGQLSALRMSEPRRVRGRSRRPGTPIRGMILSGSAAFFCAVTEVAPG